MSVLVSDWPDWSAMTITDTRVWPNALLQRQRTPLHFAVSSNQPSFVKQLISLGANVDARDLVRTQMTTGVANSLTVADDRWVVGWKDTTHKRNHCQQNRYRSGATAA
jgi:hypothetical protein